MYSNSITRSIGIIGRSVLDFILFRFFPQTQVNQYRDTAVICHDSLIISYRFLGENYVVSVPFRPEISDYSSTVEATLDDNIVTQDPCVPYSRFVPFKFASILQTLDGEEPEVVDIDRIVL